MSMVWAERRVSIGLVLVLVAFAVIVQVALFRRQSLWPDEIFSLAMATGHSLEHPANIADSAKGDFVQGDTPRTAAEWRKYIEHESPAAGPGRVVRAVLLSDTNPPLYYLLLYGWTRVFGATDATLRLFSGLWSIACIPVLVAVASRLGPPRIGMMAVALFVFLPPAVYYFAEGRMYSLLWFCTVVSAYATLRLQQDRRVWWQILWIFVSSAGLLVHYFFVFPWAAMVAYLAFTPGNDRRWLLGVRVMLALGLVLPWYAHLPESLKAWRITMEWLNLRPGGFSRFSAARDLLLQFLTGRTLSLWETPKVVEIIALIAIGMAVSITAWRLRSRVFGGPRLLIWLWLLAAWSGPLVIDMWRGTYTAGLSRYALAGLPAAILLLAGALSGVALRWRVVLLSIILGTWSVSLVSMYRWRWRSGCPTREVAQALERGGNSADVIIVHSIPSGVLAISYYMAPSAELSAWVGQLGTRRVPDSLGPLIAGRQHVWFVRIHDVGEPAPEEAWLRENAVVGKESKIGRARIIDFRPKDAANF